MQNQSNVHVKIQCDNEFRRFVLTEVTYDNLAEKIRTLLGIAPEITFKLSYLDDENDWVLFATDNELQYAVLLSKSPMKISVKLCSPSSTTTKLVAWPNTFVPNGTKMAESDELTNTEMSEEKPWKKCRGGGRGGFRGGRGGCMKNPAAFAERLDAKIARLTDRHATLTAKLIEDDLPEDKARGIEWRLSHLQNKIDMMKAKKQQLNDVIAVKKDEGHQETSPAPVQETARDEKTEVAESQQENEEFPFSGRGRRGGCRGGRGRGGSCRREHFSHETTDACEGSDPSEKKGCGGAIAFGCSTPEGMAAFELLQARKEAVQAAGRDLAG
jgi:hypothetical protein